MIWLLQHYWPLLMVCAVLGFFLTLAWMIRTVKVTRVESATVVPRQGTSGRDTRRSGGSADSQTTAAVAGSTAVAQVSTPKPGIRTAKDTATTDNSQTPESPAAESTTTVNQPTPTDGKHTLPNLPTQTGRVEKVTDLRPFDADRVPGTDQGRNQSADPKSPSKRKKPKTGPGSAGQR